MSAYASLPGLPPCFAFGTAPATASIHDVIAQASPRKMRDTNVLPSLPRSHSPKDTCPLSCKALILPTGPAPNSLKDHLPVSASHLEDTTVAIKRARVSPSELIKCLTSRRSPAGHSAAVVVQAPDVEKASATSGSGILAPESKPWDDEDTDSDDEYSMYDYSENFSSPSSSDGELDAFVQHEDTQPGTVDPSAIEFELSIAFQGRKYDATRDFAAFVKLRDDLLRELRRSRDSEAVIPDLPKVFPESMDRFGFAVAFIRATAQGYRPVMERWISKVIATFPYTRSLSLFLWEPMPPNSGESKMETIWEEG